MSVRRPSIASLRDTTGDADAAVPDGVEVLSEGGSELLASRPDTTAFARQLIELADADRCPGSAEQLQQQLPEETAACSLFLWAEPLVVTRAPGCVSASYASHVYTCVR